MNDECREVTWITAGVAMAFCCLPPGHPGPHWDQVEGWEW